MYKTMIDINKEAEEYAKLIHEKQVLKIFKEHSKRDFIAGANSKYVQAERMFSEEEVIRFLQKYRFDLSSGKTPNIGDTTKEWFSQFKK